MALEDIIKQVEDLASKAISELKLNYEGQEATEKTKRSVSILQIYKGLIQASNNRYGLQYRIVKDLAENQDDLRRIINISLPHVNPIKQIGSKEE